MCKLAASLRPSWYKAILMCIPTRSRHMAAWLATALGLLLGIAATSSAQAQTPTSEQMDMFQNMDSDQQRTILDALGSGRGGASSGIKSDRRLDFPELMRSRRSTGERRLDDDEDELLQRVVRLKAEDTVLISLDIRQLKRPPPELEERVRQRQQAVSGLPGGVGMPVPTPDPRTAEPLPSEPLERAEDETARLEQLRERILLRNPYKLDKWGILNIPELGPIPLAGLTVEEANQRVAAELRLTDFVVLVTHLPLKPSGTDGLKPFGYDLFAGVPSTFAPATDVPVPAEYVVGPGDTLQVQLLGSGKGRFALVVGRDGRINFPELGPIAVSGMRFDDARSLIEQRVAEEMIGAQASVSIGELRSIRVFVLGEAEMPGSYTVSGLSTMTNALFVSGGVNKIGSLRNIQLKRNGNVIAVLDLYDLLLKGDTRADQRLLPGDVIFIPPIGQTVGIAGEVRRPAIYELKNETRVQQLLELGGGLLPEADPTLATLEHVNQQRQRTTVGVDLSAATGLQRSLQSGDVLRVPAIRPVLENSVVLNGHVHRHGQYQYTPRMRLTDLIPTLDELKPNADQRYVLIRRELPADRRIQVLSTDLRKALAAPDSDANIALAPRDQVFVFDQESGRDRIIEPLMRELRLQSDIDEPMREVSIAGQIKVPGKFPLEPGMRVSDLVRAGGSLDESAHVGQAELTRYEVTETGVRQVELIEVDLRRAMLGDATANVQLRPFDYLVIKEVPLWGIQEEVEIRGEVKFPGRYPIHRGETLRSVMARAGGFTDLAFVEGAIFTRDELRERERKQLQSLASRMESDLAQASLMAAQETGKDAGQALAVGQSLLAGLRNAQPVGRLVIDLDQVLDARAGGSQDVVLKGGDRLLIPRITQEVTVIGEVQSAISHLHRANLGRQDYIALSGGLTPRADADRIYVVRADGSVVTRTRGSWFSGGAVEIRPGDTIVAPLDTERMRPLPFWMAVTTIIYNLAISAAAVNSF